MDGIAMKSDSKNSMRAKIQAFGGFLTGMVLPNIGAFIAWGLITALFIPTGWMPNESLGKLVGPMIIYLLPLLIAYTGGGAIAGKRGAVMGVIGTMGVIVGSDIPMFIGAMIIGPVGGYIIKKFDKAIDGKIPSGFEMIVNNFSIGILGMGLCLVAYKAIGPAILAANNVVKIGIEALVNANLLPLLSIFNEPAKVLFLNNAIDQGIYAPLGVQAAMDAGKSIFFMVASSPGPGLGLLLAYALFGKGMSKKSAPTAIIIHFLGGIHELYFPYVLMKPIMIIPMILGGMSGIVTFQALGAGLVAFPSPGSIFAFLAMTPKGGFFATIAGVAVGTAVSFVVSSFLLKLDKKRDAELDEFEESQSKVKNLKQEGKDLLNQKMAASTAPIAEHVKFIAFACDAGMGSSAMGASSFRKQLKNAGLNINVKNFAIEDVPEEVDIIVCHKDLFDRAKAFAPGKEIVTIGSFIGDPQLKVLLDRLTNQ